MLPCRATRISTLRTTITRLSACRSSSDKPPHDKLPEDPASTQSDKTNISAERQTFVKRPNQEIHSEKRVEATETLKALLKQSATQEKLMFPEYGMESSTITNILKEKDFFNVRDMFTLRDLFDARVHLGHFLGCWDPENKKYLLGTRNNHHIIDIASTQQHLWRVLNVISHIVYSRGLILFVNNKEQFRYVTQYTAKKCEEFYYTDPSTFHVERFDKKKKYVPSMVICTSVNHPTSQELLLYCNKNMIPTVGIVDSDVSTINLTYSIPGNDDTDATMILYYRLFNNAITKAKKFRRDLLNSSKLQIEKKSA